jgi:hypothetical protein
MSPNAGDGGGGGCCGASANEYYCAFGAQINFGDLTPYLAYGWIEGIGQELVNKVSQDFFISFLFIFLLGTKFEKI